MDDVLLTADEVQALLRVNRRTIYRLANAGTLPAARIGRQWRFPRREIEAWLNAGGAPVARAAEVSAIADKRPI